jgi:hypothetical protein
MSRQKLTIWDNFIATILMSATKSGNNCKYFAIWESCNSWVLALIAWRSSQCLNLESPAPSLQSPASSILPTPCMT